MVDKIAVAKKVVLLILDLVLSTITSFQNLCVGVFCRFYISETEEGMQNQQKFGSSKDVRMKEELN